MFDKHKKGSFSRSFIKQLNSLSCEIPHSKSIQLVLALPGNYRFPYLDKAFLLSEISEAFEIVYESDIKILYVKATENDDHFIKICVSMKK